MITKKIVLPYKPRIQFKPYHARHQRFSVGVAHRRCGKTVAELNDMIRRALLLDKSDGRYSYVAPQYNQAKDVAWTYLKRYTEPVLRGKNEGELWVELVNGSRIRIYGADNPDRLRGSYLDGVVVDEFADMRPSIWGEIIRPMLADRLGWASFIGTPKGRNAFYRLYEEGMANPERWFTFLLRASETGILLQSELDDAKRTMTPEQYAQEFEVSFEAAIVGAYYGKEIAEAERTGRICSVAVENDLPVHTAWDLGIGDSTSIWFFQVHAQSVRVVDFYENHGFAIPHYVGVIEARGYPQGIDFVPHDAKVRDISTGRTRVETLLSLNRRPELVPDHKVDDGINAGRLLMSRIYFDNFRCKDGIEALRQYRADYDEKLRAFKDTPKHDWTSHAADAFRYLAMAYQELAPPAPPNPLMRALQDATLDEMWEAQRKVSGRDARRI